MKNRKLFVEAFILLSCLFMNLALTESIDNYRIFFSSRRAGNSEESEDIFCLYPPPIEFFIDPRTGKPRVFVVSSKIPSEMDLELAVMIAEKIGEITATEVRIERASLLDFEYWKTDCSENIILVGGPTDNIIIEHIIEEGFSAVDWKDSPGECEYFVSLYGHCDILIVGGKNESARRKASLSLINWLDSQAMKNPCDEISCPNRKCYGYDLWSIRCVDGECVQDYIIEENSKECGYGPMSISSIPPTSTPPRSLADNPILMTIMICAALITIYEFLRRKFKITPSR